MIGARKARKRLLVSENPGISGGELIQAMDEFFHADFTHIGAGNRGYSVTIYCMVSGKSIKAHLMAGGVHRFSRNGNLWRLELDVSGNTPDFHLFVVRDRLLLSLIHI